MRKQSFVQVGDIALEFTFEQPATPNRPTLLLLHEGLGSAMMWGGFKSALAAATGAGVYAYSREGYGASSPVPLPRPLDYMRRHARDILPRVIDQIDARDIVIIGHSDGATIAALYAAAAPDPRVRAIVLIAPHFFVEDFSIREIAQAKIAYETTDLREKLARWHAHVDVAFRGWNDAWLDPNFPTALEMRAELARIRLPVLGMQGADDQYGTLAQIDALEAAIRTTGSAFERCVLPGVRHAPHREAAPETIAAIQGFMSRHLRPAPI